MRFFFCALFIFLNLTHGTTAADQFPQIIDGWKVIRGQEFSREGLTNKLVELTITPKDSEQLIKKISFSFAKNPPTDIELTIDFKLSLMKLNYTSKQTSEWKSFPSPDQVTSEHDLMELGAHLTTLTSQPFQSLLNDPQSELRGHFSENDLNDIGTYSVCSANLSKLGLVLDLFEDKIPASIRGLIVIN